MLNRHVMLVLTRCGWVSRVKKLGCSFLRDRSFPDVSHTTRSIAALPHQHQSLGLFPPTSELGLFPPTSERRPIPTNIRPKAYSHQYQNRGLFLPTSEPRPIPTNIRTEAYSHQYQSEDLLPPTSELGIFPPT